jgi:hypothetical protein
MMYGLSAAVNPAAVMVLSAHPPLIVFRPPRASARRSDQHPDTAHAP